MERLWQDLRFGIRVLRKERAFTVTTIATLALCLAANIAIFAVVNGVLLKPLPFDEPDRLVTIYNEYPGVGVAVAYNGVPDYYDRLEAVTALDELAMYRQSGVTLGGDGTETERVQALLVTPSFFRALRVQPVRGRLFDERDAEVGQDQKLVLTHGFWQRVYGGREDAVGKTLRVNGVPFEVVGILPAAFRFVDPDLQIVRPYAFTAAERADDQRHNNSWNQLGRLKAGVTIAHVQGQLNALNAANLERFSQFREVLTNAGFRTSAVDFQDHLVQAVRPTLSLLWGGAVIVLVIGCVNVTNLVLVRATARMREMATRHALGAGLGRLAGQSLTEMALVVVLGGLAGLGLAWWALAAAPLVGIDRLPRASEVGIDGQVVMFTAGMVALVGMVMAALPVAVLRRANVAQVVREEGRAGTAGRGARLARRGLVVCQVAFALVLLVGAGVLVASLNRVLAVDPGFRGERVLTGMISPPSSRYPTEDLPALADRVLEAVRMLPGVEGAGFSSMIPFGGTRNDSTILAEGYQMAPGESVISPNDVQVTDGYFEAMGAELVSGRWFTRADVEGQPRVLIIDERLARRFWPDGDAVGRRMYRPNNPDDLFATPSEDQMLTVVGVVRNMRLVAMVDTIETERPGAYYSPLAQRPARNVGLAVRTAGEPAALIDAVRRAVATVDPELPLFDIRTMGARTADALADRRTPTLLAGGFAVVALFLAAIGLYGVLAYQVSQRRREIGIRMALGAGTTRIFGLVIGEGAVIVAIGAALGLGGAFLLRRAIESQLYEVGAMDPVVLAIVGSLLVLVALVACLIPARRAAKTDPVAALAE